MKKLIKRLSLVTIVALIAAVGFGCAGGNEGGAAKKQEGALSGKIIIAGSTSVQPLAQDLASAFQDKDPDVQIDVNGGGSSAGVKAAAEGAAQIGTSSRELKDAEKGLGLVATEIARDGIAVVVHPSNNAIANLTKDQVKKIFAGQITNWKEVGGADKPITVVTREEGSGTRGAFEEIVLGKDVKMAPKAIVQSSTGGIKTAVSTTENAIGYISIGAIDTEVKPVKVDNIEATEENVKNGTFPISRPFLFLTKGEAKDLPKTFIEFVLSDEGQKIVGEDFVTVK
jgi:phosphate transport system substrate-binding protein